MAEFDNEAASLDLFQEIFSQRSSRDGTVDVVSKNVNNVVNLNAHDRSISGNFMKTSIASNNIDNDVPTQTSVTDGLINESSHEDAQDSVVRLNNIENLKKKTESTNSVSVTVESVDNTIDCTDDNQDDDHNNAANGNASTVLKSNEKTDGKQKKGISFPKDSFISGYFEPPDPWKNAPSWTTEELVLAYKKSCDLHGTKPIAKLLQQLQTCSPGKQGELLSLKGEKLDQKQCECLEEVLRRVQFRLLDLEASHLDDECAVALFDMIEYYESACQLNIAFNKNIQARGWQACSRLVRRTPNLTYLDMRSCDLNDRNIPIFGRALKLGCHLTILHMESMNLAGRPLVILVAALKVNETLQELFLADNKLMPTDGVQLGNLLRYNYKLSLLDLRNNHLQDVGTSHISDGLMEQTKSPGLRTLVLWNNAINYQAMPALGRALASNESLETLNIGHNVLTNEGVHLLKDGLLKTNSLLRIGLQGTRITDEGAVALAEYIADSTILLRIDLRDNDIKTGGLMALSHAMRVNTSVTRIDLDKDPKKESSMKDYAEQQSHLLRDIYTFQQRNIQAALKKEEEERAELEEKLQAVSRASEEETQVEETVVDLPEISSVLPLTLCENVDEEEILEQDVEHEKDRKDAENAKAKNVGEILRENQQVDLGLDDVDAILAKDDIRNRQRPSILFPYLGLPPQASLDSPLPTSNVSPLVSVLSESVSALLPIPPSQKGLLTLNMGSAPGEMILSPQYFPKQIARKIFSVSRVCEDPSWPQRSTSPTPSNLLSAAYDPLNVSTIPLIPIPTSTPPLTASPLVVPLCTLGVFQHSKTMLQASASPTSSLFQNLADETVKHMVSPIHDIDAICSLTLTQVSDNITDNTTSFAVNSNNTACFSEPSDSSVEFTSLLEKNTLDKTLFASKDLADVSDNLEPSVIETGSDVASFSTFKEDLWETETENVVVISSQNEIADFTSEDVGTLQLDPLLISENMPDYLNFPKHASDSSHDHDLHAFFDGTDFSALASGIVKGILESDISKNETGNECDSYPCDSLVFSVEESIDSAAIHSDLGNRLAVYSDQGAGDDVRHGKGVPDTEELFQQHKQHHAPDVLNDRCSSPTEMDANTVDGLVSIYFNNSNSSLMNPSEGSKELSPVICKNSSEASSSVLLSESNKELPPVKHRNSSDDSPSFIVAVGGNGVSSVRCKNGSETSHLESVGSEGYTCSPVKDLSGATGHEEGLQDTPLGVSLEASDATLNSFADVSKSNHNTEIENVDCAFGEESWLAVGPESDVNSTEKSKECLTQPDFFTTLSMNGLTQELASALTSLDGSTTSYGNEDEKLELRPHDEFEKELDALLAIVQSELPWPLKGSNNIDS